MSYAIQKSINGHDIRDIRIKLKLTQKELSDFLNVSKKTLERWESSEKAVTGPCVTLIRILNEDPELLEYYRVPLKKCSLRLWYMKGDTYCTLIDVNEPDRRIFIKNFTEDIQSRAFGANEHPDFKDYEEFLKSRCFPDSRDKMKLMLKELNLPFFDPFMIIQKTGGRKAEDDFHIVIEKL